MTLDSGGKNYVTVSLFLPFSTCNGSRGKTNCHGLFVCILPEIFVGFMTIYNVVPFDHKFKRKIAKSPTRSTVGIFPILLVD